VTGRATASRQEPDLAQDLRLFCLVVGVLGAMLALGATTQAALVLQTEASWFGQDTPLAWIARLAVNLLTVAIILLLSVTLRITGRAPRSWPLWTLLMAVFAGALRAVLQAALGLYDPDLMAPLLSDALITTVVSIVVPATGFGAVLLLRRAREAERARLQQAAQAAEALSAVQEEELRTRRRIADGLHGSVQNRLVVVEARLKAIAEAAGEPLRTEIESTRLALGRLRQDEVRTLSAALFPERFDLGAVAAIRAMLARLPGTIEVGFEVDERAQAVEGAGSRLLGEEERLHLVRAAEEALTNALRHGNATRISAALTADDERILLRFDDDGRGLQPESTMSGLARLQNRFRHAGGDLQIADGETGGVSLRAWLPLPARVTP